MAQWLSVERDGVLLDCLDHGGDGPPVLLLHGLAGRAREWDRTASWLSESHRVLALDQRGHGRSERRPADVSRTAFVEDVATVVEQLELGPVVLVGQSLGGHTALLTAARHPDLVTALVVVEAWPGADPDTPEEIAAWLASWPIPFGSRQAAVEFFADQFGTVGEVASAWADGLEEREGGWWPRFDMDTMVAAIAQGSVDGHWEEWKQIDCPTLVVRAERGIISRTDAQAMLARLPGCRMIKVDDAGHDVHLERPDMWRSAIKDFLDRGAITAGRRPCPSPACRAR